MQVTPLSLVKGRCCSRAQAGFTLIELVAVVVLLGMISLGVVRYFTMSVESYMDVNQRTQMAQTGRFMIERLTREIRTALPGSVRIRNTASPTYHCVEFVPVEQITTYLALPVSSAAAQFDVAAFPTLAAATNQYKAAVFTLSSCDIYSTDQAGNACATPRRWHALQNISGFSDVIINNTGAAGSDGQDDDGRLTLEFAAPVQYSAESPVKRLYLFRTPVAFCLQAGTDRLTRHSNYGWSLNPATSGVLLVDGVAYNTNAFSYQGASLARSDSVELSLTVQGNDEAVIFNNEVTLIHAP